MSLLMMAVAYGWQAPSLHQELQKQLASQQVMLGGGPAPPAGGAAKVCHGQDWVSLVVSQNHLK